MHKDNAIIYSCADGIKSMN